MTMTLQEFRLGLDKWPQSWDRDFHNGYYARLAAENPQGDFTSAWWQAFLPHLQAWRAIRPARREDVSRRVDLALVDLSDAWNEACAPYLDRDVEGVTWEQVGAFPDLVAHLKPSRSGNGYCLSPVFRAKFCHFLAPAIFPVVDNAMMGLPFGRSYEAHLAGVQREWEGTPEAVRVEAQDELAELIGRPLTPGYPLLNKVVELCLIGRRAQSGR